MRSPLVLLVAMALVAACEDGPEQIFEPNTGDPTAQNGYAPTTRWTQAGQAGFEELGGDAAGRAKFCDEGETSTLLQTMVQAPILPNVGAATLPLWDTDGSPLLADKLVGRPEDGKFCDAWGVYLNAFTWGPTNEIIVFFNEETRLVEGIALTQQYLGTLQGTYTTDDETAIEVIIKLRDRVKINGVVLDQYASPTDQATKPRSWMNHANINAMYRMIREAGFGDQVPDSFDCVAAKVCDIIYETDNPSVPQYSLLVIQDSGVVLEFPPNGKIDYVEVDPVRIAPFEHTAEISFSPAGIAPMAPRFASVEDGFEECSLDLGEDTSWATFVDHCTPSPLTLARANYNVETQRDAVVVEFNGIDMGFLRADTGTAGVFRDGERPADNDSLYFMQFTRSLNAEVAEFVPTELAAAYRLGLEDLLAASVHNADGTPACPGLHPFCAFVAATPDPEGSTAQRIGELLYRPDPAETETRSFVTDVIREVQDTYHDTLALDEQMMVDPQILEPVYLVHPFTDAVLSAFTYGASDRDRATIFKGFETTDDRRWSIGYASFYLPDETDPDRVPYRVVTQYSLNFGAITAVSVERGFSEIDVVLNGFISGGKPYYEISMSLDDTNPYSLGGTAITVDAAGADRQLGTVPVALQLASGLDKTLTVPGEVIEDQSGYLRQILGDRYEFVPAHVVHLYGKETIMAFYVEEDGTIGRIVQATFKGSLELCPGLAISHGEDVRKRVQEWQGTVIPNIYRDCDIVFNYSANGNVLDAVASLSNKVSFVTVDGRAVSAAMWR